jgi:hypothetical protein
MQRHRGSLLLLLLSFSIVSCPATAGESVGSVEITDSHRAGPETTVEVARISDEEREGAQALLGWNQRDDTAIQEEVASSVERAGLQQDFVVTCMAAAGFDYVPLAEERQFTAIEDPGIPRGSPEFAKTYGFGISTLLLSTDEVGEGVIAYNPLWLDRARPLDAGQDPNVQYFHSLDESGQAAFSETLGECWREAANRFPDRGAALRRDLADDLSDLDQRIKADDRSFELAASVDDCMQVEGYTFTDLESLGQAVEQRMIDRGLVIRGGGEEPPELSETERDARLIEVQQFELALATEFDRCIGLRTWYERWEEIADTYQAQFLATHWSTIHQS